MKLLYYQITFVESDIQYFVCLYLVIKGHPGCEQQRRQYRSRLQDQREFVYLRKFSRVFLRFGSQSDNGVAVVGVISNNEHAVSVANVNIQTQPIHKQEVGKQIEKLLRDDVIESSINPCNSQLLLVPKECGSPRSCQQ